MMLDIRIMAVPKRREMVQDILAQLSMDEHIVTYDDRPGGGDAMYTARKTWLHPLTSGTTHRLVLQDDVELCDDFVEIVTTTVKQFPNAVITLYNTNLTMDDRKVDSPYFYLPGCRVRGVANVLPMDIVYAFFAWVDKYYPMHQADDVCMGNFLYWRKIRVMTTAPSTVRHLCESKGESALGHAQDADSRTKLWIGRDLSATNWETKEFTTARMLLPFQMYHNNAKESRRWRE